MVAPNASTDLLKPVGPLDVVLEVLMAVLCFFTPLAFGTIEAWSQEIFLAIVTVLVACAALRFLLDPTARLKMHWEFVAVVFFLAFCLFQLVPLPAAVIGHISAETYHLKSELLSDLPDAPSLLRRMTITFYAQASREQLRLVLAVAAVFAVVVNYYVTAARIKRLLLTVAAAGLAVALMALFQNITGANTVYGIVQVVDKNSGPFMCYSHFGQFVNLSVGAAFALLLVRVTEVYRRHGNAETVMEELRQPRSWMLWILTAICILGPIAVFLSLTKMGIISLLASAGFTAAMLTWRSRTAGRTSLLLAIAIVAFGVLLCVGFDAVYSRLATLRNVRAVEGGRLQMLKDMTAEFKLFPLVGTGLGTHEFVFPQFDHSHIPNIATHAENEYAQLLEECGIIGVAAAMLFLACMVFNYCKIIRHLQKPIHYAAFGLGLGLVAILIHSASDFGQHLPANAVLTAISAGLLVNLAKDLPKTTKSQDVDPDPKPWFAVPRLLPFGTFLVAAVILAATLPSANKCRLAEYYWNQAFSVQTYLQEKSWQGTNDDYTKLLTPAVAATELVPDNITYKYWLNVFRWQAITRVSDARTHNVVFTPESQNRAARIIDELHAIRPLCPTFGPPLGVAGQIEYFVFHRPEGREHMEQAFRLTPYERVVCFIAGKVAVDAGQWDQSLVAFERCAALSGFDGEIIDTYLAADRPDLALKIAEGNRRRLSYLAEQLQGNAKYQEIARSCHNQATALLSGEANQPNASADVMATLAAQYADDNNNAQAILWYRKALRSTYEQVDWHLRLATILAAAGQDSDAMEEARVCLRLRPQCSEAQKIIGDLTVRKDATGGATRSSSRPSDAPVAGQPTP